MSLTPIGILRVGRRTALRRRYGYAALRIMRRTLRKALQVHHARVLDVTRPYSVSVVEIRAAYFANMRALRARFPNLDYLDPRAEP